MRTAALIAALALSALPAAQAENLGRYERIAVPGPSLEGNLEGSETVRDVSVYLPPGYDESEKRYPVVYLLHGFTGSDEGYFGDSESFVHAPDAIDAAWEAGAAGLIVVMPNAFTRYWGSMYSNSVTTGNWEAYIAEDLVGYIDANYRTLPKREGRGIGGHSMGGYGALRIGMKYPDVFSSIYAMSPCCMAFNTPSVDWLEAAAAVRTDQEIAEANFGIKAMLASAAAWSPNPGNPPLYLDLPLTNGEIDRNVLARWAANAPLVTVHQNIPALKRYRAIHFDAGDMDVGIVGTVHELDAVLDAYGVEHVAEEYEGDHVNRIHARLASKVIPMFSENLARE